MSWKCKIFGHDLDPWIFTERQCRRPTCDHVEPPRKVPPMPKKEQVTDMDHSLKETYKGTIKILKDSVELQNTIIKEFEERREISDKLIKKLETMIDFQAKIIKKQGEV